MDTQNKKQFKQMLGVQWRMDLVICFRRFNAFSIHFTSKFCIKVLRIKFCDGLPTVLDPIDFHCILVDPMGPEMVWLPTFTRSNAIEEPNSLLK